MEFHLQRQELENKIKKINQLEQEKQEVKISEYLKKSGATI
jgi:hypothetical protein